MEPGNPILAERPLPGCTARRLETAGIGKPAKTWLFNLAVDPTEQNNLSAEAPEKLAELQGLLANHRATAPRQPLYPYQGEMGVAVDKTLAEQFEEGDEYIFWPN